MSEIKTIKGKVNDIITWNLKYSVIPKSVNIEYINKNIFNISPTSLTGNYTYFPGIKSSRSYRLKILKSDNSIVYSNNLTLQ